MKHGKTAEGNVPNLTSAGPFWMQGTSSASSLNAGAPKEPGSATAPVISNTPLLTLARLGLGSASDDTAGAARPRPQPDSEPVPVCLSSGSSSETALS